MASSVDKTPCTLDDLSVVNGLPLKIGDTIIGYVDARQFKTKSIGLSFTGKVRLPLADGKTAYLQCSANFTVIGSKPKEEKEEKEEAAAEAAIHKD